MLCPEEEGTQRAGPCASWGQEAWCLIPGGVVRPGAPVPALWQCQCSLAGSPRGVCMGPPCPPAPGVSAYLPEALQLGALPLGPGMGTGLAGFATPMSCEKSGSSGRAGRRRQCCPVLDPPPPIPPSPLSSSPPFSGKLPRELESRALECLISM